MRLGPPRYTKGAGECLALGLDERTDELFLVTATELRILNADTFEIQRSVALPGGADLAGLCLARRTVVYAKKSAIRVLGIDLGKVLASATAPGSVVCLDVSPGGDACFGLSGGGVSQLPYQGQLASGAGGDQEIRAIGYAGAAGVIAEVSEPDTSSIDVEIAVRNSTLGRSSRTVRYDGESGRGIVEIYKARAVGIGQTGNMVVVGLRRVQRRLSGGRQDVDGAVVIVDIGRMSEAKRLEGREFADIHAIGMHPRSERFAAMGNEYSNAGYGVLSVLDVRAGRLVDSRDMRPAVRRLRFSHPDGRLLCGTDADGRAFVIPVILEP